MFLVGMFRCMAGYVTALGGCGMGMPSMFIFIPQASGVDVKQTTSGHVV